MLPHTTFLSGVRRVPLTKPSRFCLVFGFDQSTRYQPKFCYSADILIPYNPGEYSQSPMLRQWFWNRLQESLAAPCHSTGGYEGPPGRLGRRPRTRTQPLVRDSRSEDDQRTGAYGGRPRARTDADSFTTNTTLSSSR